MVKAKKQRGSGGGKGVEDEEEAIIYCRQSEDALVDGKCPNPLCPLFGEPQGPDGEGDDGPASDGDRL